MAEKHPDVAWRISIRGRVQGVGFRYSALQAAGRCGVGGWVRNEYDGSVTAHCEGSEEACRRFINWCKKGPTSGRVDSAHPSPARAEGFRTFIIRH